MSSHPSLRRVLIDIIEEYARHVGHADLIRESVDGLVGGPPALTLGHPLTRPHLDTVGSDLTLIL